MRRTPGSLATLFALGLMFTTQAQVDARQDGKPMRIAEASGLREWLVDRVQSFMANRTAEATLKIAEAALKHQGGSRILLKLDTDALRDAMAIELRDEVRRLLREARIGFAGLAARDGSVEVRIREVKDRDNALSKLSPAAIAAASGGGAVDVADAGDGLLKLTPTAQAFADRVHTVRRQSIEVIERRLAGAGVAAAAVQPDELDRIRVLLPGVKDPERLSALFNKRARITFRLVDETMTGAEALQGTLPPTSEILYQLNTKVPLLLLKRVALEGDDIVDAAPGFDQRTNEPIVTFRFNASGTRRFAQVTQENVGHPFAIVLDNDVLSVPVIREPILGGSGQISGSFSLEDANAIAVLLRSGMLPGRLIVVEQQVVEPAPGQ
jgi:preprotein translocase subunit SecD